MDLWLNVPFFELVPWLKCSEPNALSQFAPTRIRSVAGGLTAVTLHIFYNGKSALTF